MATAIRNLMHPSIDTFRNITGTQLLISNQTTSNIYIEKAGLVGFGNLGSDRGFAFVFQSHKSNNISGIDIAFFSCGQTGDVRCRVETLGSDGKPTGTLYHANADVTSSINVSTNPFIHSFTFASSFSITKGDKVALVLTPVTNVATCYPNLFYQGSGSFPRVIRLDGSIYTEITGNPATPCFSISYSNGEKQCPRGIFPFSKSTLYTIRDDQASSSPVIADEIGVIFKVPFSCRLTEFLSFVDCDGNGTYTLYSGTTEQIAVVAGDDNTTSKGTHRFIFANDPLLVKDVYYRLALKSTQTGSGTSIKMDVLDYLYNTTECRNQWAYGEWGLTYRFDNGTWTDDFSKVPIFSVMFSEISLGGQTFSTF